MCSCGKYKRPSVPQMIEAVGSTLPFLKYTFCAYQDQFTANLASQGVEGITEADLPRLAQYWENGTDTSGNLMVDGKPFTFSIQQAVDNIDALKPTRNNCSIQQ